MPNETAFLVDPMGQAPEVIDVAVHKILLQYLNLPENSPARDAIEWLLWQASQAPGMDDKEVLSQSLWHYTNTFDHSLAAGVLASVRAGEISDLTEEETKVLQDTLMAIRVGGWFPQWFALQVGAIANGEGIPGDRHPTPLQIAATLTDCVQEHEERMETARQFAQMRPDLILGATLEPVATQEPPKGTTEHPRARKSSRKKAQRA